MKFFSTLFIISFFASLSTNAQITLLPSAGVQTIVAKMEGSSPLVSKYNQYQTYFTASLRAFLNNKKGHGLFAGVSYINCGLSVESYQNNPSPGIFYSQGRQSTIDTRPRLELGYQFLSKKIFLNNLLAGENKRNTGLYLQIQGMVGIGYNFTRNPSSGHMGGGGTQLSDLGGGNNYSFLGGGNIYVGKNDKPWFFISVMRNSNFGRYYSAAGEFNSVHNGTGYTQRIHSMGSGMSFSIGVPIRLGGKKNN